MRAYTCTDVFSELTMSDVTEHRRGVLVLNPNTQQSVLTLSMGLVALAQLYV